MLTSASTIIALSQCPQLTERPTSTLAVLDPVMISTSGHTLLPDDAIEALKGLFKVVDWLTPNIPEALRLSGSTSTDTTGQSIGGLQDLVKLAKRTAEQCDVPIILLKGGHHPIPRDQLRDLDAYTVVYEDGEEEIECLNLWRQQTSGQSAERGQVVADILIQRGSAKPTLFVGNHVKSDSTHGTGCTLSSAIAAAYAKSAMTSTSDGAYIPVLAPMPHRDGREGDARTYGSNIGVRKRADLGVETVRNVEIAKSAIEYTRSAIATAYKMGQGHGPLNHSHLTTRRGLPPPTVTNPHPFVSHLIQSDLPLWKSYVGLLPIIHGVIPPITVSREDKGV